MTQLISVITPVHPPSLPHLKDAYESLRAQEMPNGWGWEWVVQEDGKAGILDDALPRDDDRIRPGTGRSGGPGVARTLALARATGALVKVLDADDILTPGVIERDINALTNAEIGWSTSRVLDLLPDGTTAGFSGDPAAGRLARGAVLEYWRAHDHRASVHPATLCIRRDLLLALGGWMALPASEDTGLLIAASVVSDGFFNADVGLLYRKWPGQVTQQPAHLEAMERDTRLRLIDDRARALLALERTLNIPNDPGSRKPPFSN